MLKLSSFPFKGKGRMGMGFELARVIDPSPPISLYVAEFKLSAPARLWSLTLARAKIVGESGAARSFLLF